MPDGAQVIIRLSKRARTRLDKIAAATAQSPSRLVGQAIDAYLRDQERQLRRIDTGIKDIEAGRIVEHERVTAWLRSWGRKGTRERVVPGTPYVLPYRVRKGVVEIAAVVHGARDWPPEE